MKKILVIVVFFFAVSLLANSFLSSTATALNSNAESGFNDGLKQIDGKTGADGLTTTLKNVINTLLFVAGIAAVIIIVVGGLRFVTAEGDSNGTNRAKNTVIYASIGLVVSVLSYAMVNFILDQL